VYRIAARVGADRNHLNALGSIADLFLHKSWTTCGITMRLYCVSYISVDCYSFSHHWNRYHLFALWKFRSSRTEWEIIIKRL